MHRKHNYSSFKIQTNKSFIFIEIEIVTMDNDDHISEHIFHIKNNDELDQVLYIDIENNNEYSHQNVELKLVDFLDDKNE